MATTLTSGLADRVIATLRAHEAELRQAGITRLSLFGSVARGDDEATSDVDVAAQLSPAAQIGLWELCSLQDRVSGWLDRPVDLVAEPVAKGRLQTNIDRDRRIVF